MEEGYKMIGSSPEAAESSDHQGKQIVIKLKFPKTEKGIEKESKKAKNDEGLKKMNVRVCPECKKEFSSGKALGGHMRVHAIHYQSSSNNNSTIFNQNPSNISSSKKFFTASVKKVKKNDDLKVVKKQIAAVKKPYYMESVNNEGIPMCSQCGKTFPSMKSLFGHMRCHPERVWRGILPPPNIDNNNSLTLVNNNEKVVDLSKFLRGWGVTEKRGRPSLIKQTSVNNNNDFDDENENENDDGVLLEAVEDLMSLANCVTTFEGSNSSSVVLVDKAKFELLEDDDNAYKRSVNKMKKRKKMKLMMELEEKQEVVVNEEDDTVTTTTTIPNPVCKYKCTTCNKCFNSHQALGGHRSSHNKYSSTKIILDHHQEDHYDQSIIIMDQKEDHRCKICDKVFPTGQALGGHKRCHWSGLLTEPHSGQAPSSQITTSNTGEGQIGSGCRKVLDFDLNEIPIEMSIPTEEEEDMITIGLIGNEYASSSYNSNMS